MFPRRLAWKTMLCPRGHKHKNKRTSKEVLLFLVEATGLEPTASWSRTKRSTKLSHASKLPRYYSEHGEICQPFRKIFLKRSH